ncbi:MAG: hypothetical protein JW889_10635 [Verrucomicrobia bacterium]|nr:hypothetical protein [Verrucomicrobiota bacterium]
MLVENEPDDEIEPLGLPHGSIRALVTAFVSATCWVFIFTGAAVPSSLLSLMLTIIGYYYGLRSTTARHRCTLSDEALGRRAPLGLPSGLVRGFLFVGFLASGIVLCAQGRLWCSEYLRFFGMIAGLLLGYVYTRLFPAFRPTAFFTLVNHVKGVLVLVVTAVLMALIVAGRHDEYVDAAFALSAAIGFYFGSRS